MPLLIHDQPLPYVAQLPERVIGAVELVVIHCTELPTLANAREYGEKALYEDGCGNSGHYYVDRDGSIYCYVAGTRIAHHVRGHNDPSIGIELVNRGRYPHWWDSRAQRMTEPYPAGQINALGDLLTQLCRDFPNLRWIAGHEDLDTAMLPATDDATVQVHRKLDPGPMFPWTEVLAGSPLTRFTPT
ncbi:MAG: N-acetylmuramoyl-L-alanine amidase [Rhodanobacter sp.]